MSYDLHAKDEKSSNSLSAKSICALEEPILHVRVKLIWDKNIDTNFDCFKNPGYRFSAPFLGLRKILILRSTYSVTRFLFFHAFSYDIL